MSVLTIIGGTFDTDAHAYRDSAGAWVPSLTQIIKLAGLSNHFNGNSDVMEAAKSRGSEVHAIAAALLKYGELDPTWLTEQTEPYFEAVQRFLSGSGFVPESDFIEAPMIAEYRGLQFGVTPDAMGSRRHPTVVEFKTSEAYQPWWPVQLSGQALARFGEHRGQAVQRWAVQLKRNGKYQIHVCDQHAGDMATFLQALSLVHWRLRNGQKLWESE